MRRTKTPKSSVKTKHASVRSKKSKKVKSQPLQEGIRRNAARSTPKRKTPANFFAIVEKRRKRLIPKGLKDKEIARELAKEMKVHVDTVYKRMRKDVKNGRLEENPNNLGRDRYTDDEINIIKNEWEKLIRRGFNTKEAVVRISEKLEERDYRAVMDKVKKMLRSKKLRRNPNRRSKRRRKIPTMEEVRKEYIANGRDDLTIAREAAKILGKTVGSLKWLIWARIVEGSLPENPNNQVSVSEEAEWLVNRREELASIGLTDRSITLVLAGESETRKWKELERMLSELVGMGKLDENKNNEEDSKVIEHVILKRRKLILKGMDDRTIARKLAGKLKKKPRTIEFLIYRNVTNGNFEENPNNKAGGAG